jgi:hypothetical protein
MNETLNLVCYVSQTWMDFYHKFGLIKLSVLNDEILVLANSSNKIHCLKKRSLYLNFRVAYTYLVHVYTVLTDFVVPFFFLLSVLF